MYLHSNGFVKIVLHHRPFQAENNFELIGDCSFRETVILGGLLERYTILFFTRFPILSKNLFPNQTVSVETGTGKHINLPLNGIVLLNQITPGAFIAGKLRTRLWLSNMKCIGKCLL